MQNDKTLTTYFDLPDTEESRLIIALKNSLYMIEARTNYPYENYDKIRKEANECLTRIKVYLENKRKAP